MTGVGQEYEAPLNAELVLDGRKDIKIISEIVLEIAK